MLKIVFDYVKANKMCTVTQIADKLSMREIDVVVTANELCERRFLDIVPIPLSIENNDSVWYIAVKESFHDNSEFCKCKKLHSVFSDTDSSSFGYWDTCAICGKHIEDGFHYYNHHDGEDHDNIDL